MINTNVRIVCLFIIISVGLMITVLHIVKNSQSYSRDYVRGGSEGALAPPPPGILGFREENRERNRQSITNSPTGIKILTWSLYSIHKPKLSYPKPAKKASKIKAIETGIFFLIDQLVNVIH